MKAAAMHLWKEERGEDLTEYALLIAIIVLAAIATMKSFSEQIRHVFSNAASSLSSS